MKMKTGKLRCKIAELIVDVPFSLTDRCKEYVSNIEGNADIEILEERYRPELYKDTNASFDEIEYQETARQFYFFY